MSLFWVSLVVCDHPWALGVVPERGEPFSGKLGVCRPPLGTWSGSPGEVSLVWVSLVVCDHPWAPGVVPEGGAPFTGKLGVWRPPLAS